MTSLNLKAKNSDLLGLAKEETAQPHMVLVFETQ